MTRTIDTNKKLLFLINHFYIVKNKPISFKNTLSNTANLYFKSNRQIGSKDRKYLSELLFTYYRYKFYIDSYKFNSQIEEFLTIYQLSEKVLKNSDTFSFINNQIDDFFKNSDENFRLIYKDFAKYVESSPDNMFPKIFNEQILKYYNDEVEGAKNLIKSLNSKSPVTIRLISKNDISKTELLLKSNNITFEKTSLDTFNIKSFINFDLILSSNNIQYEVQDNGSVIISNYIAEIASGNILDACAGSGGKSLSILSYNSRVNIDMFDTNINRLNQYFKRNTNPNINVIKNIDKNKFYDLVFVDAPCSGSGTIRRNPDKKFTITDKIINNYSEIQFDILNQYANNVKLNGLLVYITCSLFDKENIDVVNKFLNNSSNFFLFKTNNKILDEFSINISNFANILLPINYDGDIFFIATLKRIS